MHTNDRAAIMDRLTASRDALLGAVVNLTPAQWDFRPNTEAWSPAQCVQHLTITERWISKELAKALAASPDPDRARAASAKDTLLETRVASRSRKVKGPESAMPQEPLPDREAILQHFLETRERLLEVAAKTQTELRQYCFPHFAIGDLDCYQWLIFVVSHCKRHTLQIEELKADPSFPC